MDFDADVAIVGVGTMGSMAAWQLAERGVSVVGFEQFGIAHEFGAHGGESRIFRVAYTEGAKYVPLLRQARELWLTLQQATDRQVFVPCGGLSIGAPDAPGIANVLDSVREFGLDHEMLDAAAMAERYPQHPMGADEIAVFDPLAGLLRPEFAVAAAVARAERLGARIVRRHRVHSVLPDPTGVTVRAGDQVVRVRKAVVATGSWAANLFPAMRGLLVPRRIVISWFQPREDTAAYRPDRFPIFVRRKPGMPSLSGFPIMDGGMVKVAPNSPKPIPDARELDRRPTEDELEWLSGFVREFLPGLLPDASRSGVYTDGFCPDDEAIVGSAPGAPRVVLALGFSGHGFKLAPTVGATIADVVTGGTAGQPIGHWAPDRFSWTSNLAG